VDARNCAHAQSLKKIDHVMAFESEKQQQTIRRWSRFAILLLGTAESGRFDHITPAVITRALESGHVFELLERELPATVWEISKLTDVDRHQLERHWKVFAQGYEPEQFHVRRNGLALLVAYVLHLIDILHTKVPV
jgi:hypothetical protein